MILQIIGIRIQHEGKWYKLRDTYDWFDILKDVYSVWSRFLSCVTKNREKGKRKKKKQKCFIVLFCMSLALSEWIRSQGGEDEVHTCMHT